MLCSGALVVLGLVFAVIWGCSLADRCREVGGGRVLLPNPLTWSFGLCGISMAGFVLDSRMCHIDCSLLLPCLRSL